MFIVLYSDTSLYTSHWRLLQIRQKYHLVCLASTRLLCVCEGGGEEFTMWMRREEVTVWGSVWVCGLRLYVGMWGIEEVTMSTDQV